MESRDIEKEGFEHKAAASDSGSDNSHGFSPEEQKNIIRRVDRRLVVTLGLMYCVSLMDRTNMGAAAIAGMLKDLVLINNKYVGSPVHAMYATLVLTVLQQVASLVFFTTYVAFQPPATVVIRKVGPRPFLAAITLFWGVVMIGMGFTKNFDQLAALRIVLGIFEAGFFPGCVYLLSTWYTRCRSP
jgi:MFS transporter, ACS family, DAL5 transporter family protein